MPNKSKKKENNISNENLLNKKTKEDREKIHDKYSGDNLRNKCITLVLRHLRNFINEKIKEKENQLDKINDQLQKSLLFIKNKYK